MFPLAPFLEARIAAKSPPMSSKPQDSPHDKDPSILSSRVEVGNL